ANGSTFTNTSQTFVNGRSINLNGDTINTNNRTTDNSSTTNYFNSNLNWSKKFKKKGRNFYLQLSQGYRETNGDGHLNSVNSFNPIDTIAYSQNFDQRKKSQSINTDYGWTLSYTEPLSEVFFLESNYTGQMSHSKILNHSFNQDVNGNYEDLDSLYSSEYEYNSFTNRLGTTLRYSKAEITAGIGVAASNTDWQQIDQLQLVSYDRNFINFFPSAYFNFRKTSSLNFRLRYSGNTSQ